MLPSCLLAARNTVIIVDFMASFLHMHRNLLRSQLSQLNFVDSENFCFLKSILRSPRFIFAAFLISYFVIEAK